MIDPMKNGIATKRLLLILTMGAFTACSASSLSGEYGGDDCPFRFTFKGDTLESMLMGHAMRCKKL